ncbi:MAG: hypothetical protein WCW84_06830 [Sulfurimonas sp.]|jgi:hypothetical protein
MALVELYETVKNDRKMILIKTDKNFHTFGEDALLISRMLGWRLELLGKDKPYIKLMFKAPYLKGVMQKLHDEHRLGIVVYEAIQTQDGEEKLTRISANREKDGRIAKHEYIGPDEVRLHIQRMVEETEEFTTAKLKKIRTGSEQTFLLHKKSKNLSRWFFLSTSRYMPKAYRNSLGSGLMTTWTSLMHEINKIRNIPPHLKEKEHAFLSYSTILSECSTYIDTLKDYVDAVFHVGGWKNYRQYRFINLRLIEIGKLTQGVLSAATKRFKALAVA